VASHNRVLVVYGDLVFNLATLGQVTASDSAVIIDKQNQIRQDEVGVNVNIAEEKAAYFSYGLPIKWAQILFLTGKELELFRALANDRERSRLYTFELLNMIMEKGGVFAVVEPKDMLITEVDSQKDVLDIRCL
jgi:hypothetical protein